MSLAFFFSHSNGNIYVIRKVRMCSGGKEGCTKEGSLRVAEQMLRPLKGN